MGDKPLPLSQERSIGTEADNGVYKIHFDAKDDKYVSISETLGRQWSSTLLKFLSEGKRFNKVKEGIKGLNSKTLSTNLSNLLDAGLIEHHEVKNGRVPYYEYRLTERGSELADLTQNSEPGMIEGVFKRKHLLNIMYELFSGGANHFNQLRKALAVISAKTLSLNLKYAERKGLVKKAVIENPSGVEYSLTEAGKSLYEELIEPVLVFEQFYDQRTP